MAAATARLVLDYPSLGVCPICSDPPWAAECNKIKLGDVKEHRKLKDQLMVHLRVVHDTHEASVGWRCHLCLASFDGLRSVAGHYSRCKVRDGGDLSETSKGLSKSSALSGADSASSAGKDSGIHDGDTAKAEVESIVHRSSDTLERDINTEEVASNIYSSSDAQDDNNEGKSDTGCVASNETIDISDTSSDSTSLSSDDDVKVVVESSDECESDPEVERVAGSSSSDDDSIPVELYHHPGRDSFLSDGDSDSSSTNDLQCQGSWTQSQGGCATPGEGKSNSDEGAKASAEVPDGHRQQCQTSVIPNRGAYREAHCGGGTAKGKGEHESDEGSDASADESFGTPPELSEQPYTGGRICLNEPESVGDGLSRELGELQRQQSDPRTQPSRAVEWDADTPSSGDNSPTGHDFQLSTGMAGEGAPDSAVVAPASDLDRAVRQNNDSEGKAKDRTTSTEREGKSWVCEECQRVFSTKAGKQQHRRTVHPAEYNSSLPDPSTRVRFTGDVLADIVEACIEWPGLAVCGEGIGQYVSSRYPAYTADQIYALRKRTHYRDAERAEREERRRRLELDAAALNAEGEITPAPRTSGETPHVAGRHEVENLAETSSVSEYALWTEASQRAQRPGRLTASESKAWDYYESVCDGGDISELYGNLLRHLMQTDSEGENRSARPSRGPMRHPTQGPEPTHAARAEPPTNREERKRSRYALHQRLYEQSPFSLMSELRQPGAPCANVPLPATAEVARVYGERFGSDSPRDDHQFHPIEDSEVVDLKPFSEGEVIGVMKALGVDTAPGPDGVTVSMIVDWGVNVVVPIVNSFLWTGRIPDQLRLNRTTLIPKKAKPESVNDYRPLSIGQFMNRIYTKLLTKRLMAKVKLHPRQKAFMPVDGCSEHVFVVGEALEQCRKQRKECNLVFLDLAKAFDMVSHCSIQRAMARFGVGPGFAAIVKDLYTGVSTVIRGAQGPTDEISMTRGVKQGCPLSPILFNMVMDELMGILGTRHELKPREDLVGFNVLAFADDLVLASGTVHGMNWLLTRVRDFFTDRSMKVNAAKSHTIRLAAAPGTRTVKVVDGSTFSYGDEPIQNRKITETVKYLGLSFSPKGLKNHEIGEAKRDLKLIQDAALKPEQKLDMIRRVLVPTQMHSLRLSRRVFLRVVRKLDREVRKTVRGTLHLPPGTPLAFFYMKACDGGLAIPHVTPIVGFARLKRQLALMANEDGLVASYARVSATLDREVRCWTGAFGIEEVSSQAVKKAKNARLRDVAKRYRTTPVGRLFDSSAARTGNPWLTQPKSLRGGAFVVATKMMSENLPVRMNLHRGRGQARRWCRRCGSLAETQLHVLNECRTTKHAQIRRHNWVCNSIQKRLMTDTTNSTVTVLTEYRVSVKGEEYRPDLVIIRGHQVIVVDVAVCYDNRADRLSGRYRDKIQKYEVLKDALLEQLNTQRIDRGPPYDREVVTEFKVDAVVVGSRGLLLKETCCKPLTRLGIGENWYLRAIQEGVVRGSVMVWRAFTC